MSYYIACSLKCYTSGGGLDRFALPVLVCLGSRSLYCRRDAFPREGLLSSAWIHPALTIPAPGSVILVHIWHAGFPFRWTSLVHLYRGGYLWYNQERCDVVFPVSFGVVCTGNWWTAIQFSTSQFSMGIHSNSRNHTAIPNEKVSLIGE